MKYIIVSRVEYHIYYFIAIFFYIFFTFLFFYCYGLFYNLLDAGVIKDYKKPIVDYLIIPMDGVDEFTFNIYNQYFNTDNKLADNDENK